jgi:hypothetical protein
MFSMFPLTCTDDEFDEDRRLRRARDTLCSVTINIEHYPQVFSGRLA